MNSEKTLSGDGGLFPETDWEALGHLKLTNGDAPGLVDRLSRAYWRPLWIVAQNRGLNSEDARDAVQGFFLHAITTSLFTKPTEALGRFRSYLYRSFCNYLAGLRRREVAASRRPRKGLVSLDELDSGEVEGRGGFADPSFTDEEDRFRTEWTIALIHKTLSRLREACESKSRMTHFDVFNEWLVLPVLDPEAARSPSGKRTLAELAQKYRLTVKQASNVVVTMKRAFRRALHEELKELPLTETSLSIQVREALSMLEIHSD